jgi:hypothetical protein
MHYDGLVGPEPQRRRSPRSLVAALAVAYVLTEAARVSTNFAERPTSFQLAAAGLALALTGTVFLIAEWPARSAVDLAPPQKKAWPT